MMLPASINGIGMREGIFIFAFASFGITKPEAIAFAWIVYGLILLTGLSGGVVHALRK